jgi:ParB/RepB/Spo0J family partition protein
MTDRKVINKKLSELKPNPHNARNTRKDYSKNDPSMQELIKDIKIRGVLSPLKIFKDGTILFGNRRYHAAKYIGIKELPCIVETENVDKIEQLMQQVSENMIRKYPSSHERGKAFYELIKSGAATLAEIKEQTGSSDVEACIREYKNFLATEAKIGKDRTKNLMDNLRKRPDYGTIAKTVFKRTEIPEESKADLLEIACNKRATSHAVENVTQQIQKVSGLGKSVSTKNIAEMMDKAMETDRHQIIARNEDWEYFKAEWKKMKEAKVEATPATVRHLYIGLLKWARDEIEKRGGYYPAIMVDKITKTNAKIDESVI